MIQLFGLEALPLKFYRNRNYVIFDHFWHFLAANCVMILDRVNLNDAWDAHL